MASSLVTHLYHLRMGPRKVRLVADMIRGKRVAQAESILSLLPKAAALPLRKLLKSATANAEHNFSAKEDDLVIQSLTVDPGPMLKRSTPKAFGRAAPIRKRSSHVHMTLVSMQGKLVAKKTELAKPLSQIEVKSERGATEAKKSSPTGPVKPQKGARGGFLRKMFQRKSGM